MRHTIEQTICQLHGIWKNTNSCEIMVLMRAQVLMGVHGCSWLFMRAYGSSCVFVCLFAIHFLSTKKNLRWRSQPWADFFLELSAIQGFERAFFEISSGSSSFVKTNCQDWMAFHLSKSNVRQKNKEESPGEDWLYSFFLQKLNGQSSPDSINH